jgi:Domain of unknown function (DUF4349)
MSPYADMSASRLDTTLPGNVGDRGPSRGAPEQPQPAPLQADADPDRPTTQRQRQIIYTADVNLLAFNVNSVIEQVRTIATQMGGYMTALERQSITVRIPAARFDELINQVSRMGEVLAKNIKAADVTEELRDLNIRLENAERTRQRLLDHLKDSNKMEDTLKIEAELARVTESVEVMKGRMRYLGDQVAYSTVRVNVNSPMPQRSEHIQIPFAWVREIGVGLASGSVAPVPLKGGFFNRGARFELPKSYVRYFDSEQLTQAMSADGMFIKLQRFPNYDSVDASFWSSLAKRVLKEQRSVTITEESKQRLRNGDEATIIRGQRDVGGMKQSYALAIVAKQKTIHVFEAWGPTEQFSEDWSELQKSIETLQTK